MKLLAICAALIIATASNLEAAPVHSTVAIATRDEALTFARSGTQTLAVTAYENGRIEGVDLTPVLKPGEDAVDLVNRLGYDAAKDAIAKGTKVAMQAAALDIPVRLTASHIAAGTNYREHAQEATVQGGPFLFPKLVEPTSSRAPIPAGNALLDYEVELCLVAMKPLGPNDKASGGLILCNDVTDRATLLRNIDPSNPQSGKGFTSGKSAPGYLPVGDLFVVPRDLKAFVAGLDLQLSVNGQERQRARVTEWIWDLDEILRQARAKRAVTWTYWGGTARFPFDSQGTIPARTLVLAGTPAGTVFKGVNTGDYAFGILDWLIGGWDKTIAHHVVERHIAGARAAKTYLQSGDTVTIQVGRLGRLENKVAP
ncbi:MAG: fumarylacetoacetate hydrolase family protein [Alphaproteobacteria bacterium]|nr:fumarylacetoacetate hydrolase family protein [Alphaproteobacteria bacterium]